MKLTGVKSEPREKRYDACVFPIRTQLRPLYCDEPPGFVHYASDALKRAKQLLKQREVLFVLHLRSWSVFINVPNVSAAGAWYGNPQQFKTCTALLNGFNDTLNVGSYREVKFFFT